MGTGRFLGISLGKARGRPRAIQDTFKVNLKVLLTLDTVIGYTREIFFPTVQSFGFIPTGEAIR